MKKLFCIALALVMLSGIAIPAAAVTPRSPEVPVLNNETVARVNREILSGEITSSRDVFAVALAQLSTKPQLYSDTADGSCAPLTIAQVLSTQSDVDGTLVQDIAVTALLAFDENGIQITSDYVNRFGSQSLSILDGNITATTTMVVRLKPVGITGADSKVYNIYTIFQNKSGYIADSLQHHYALMPLNLETLQSSDLITHPANNTSYRFYPSTDYIAKGAGDAVYWAEATIVVNGETYRNFVRYSLSFLDFID